MSRTSPFRIVLSKQEREALERRARKYTLPYFEVLRAKMILLAAQRGRSNDEIGASLDIGGTGASGQSVAQAVFP